MQLNLILAVAVFLSASASFAHVEQGPRDATPVFKAKTIVRDRTDNTVWRVSKLLQDGKTYSLYSLTENSDSFFAERLGSHLVPATEQLKVNTRPHLYVDPNFVYCNGVQQMAMVTQFNAFIYFADGSAYGNVSYACLGTGYDGNRILTLSRDQFGDFVEAHESFEIGQKVKVKSWGVRHPGAKAPWNYCAEKTDRAGNATIAKTGRIKRLSNNGWAEVGSVFSGCWAEVADLELVP